MSATRPIRCAHFPNSSTSFCQVFSIISSANQRFLYASIRPGRFFFPLIVLRHVLSSKGQNHMSQCIDSERPCRMRVECDIQLVKYEIPDEFRLCIKSYLRMFGDRDSFGDLSQCHWTGKMWADTRCEPLLFRTLQDAVYICTKPYQVHHIQS